MQNGAKPVRGLPRRGDRTYAESVGTPPLSEAPHPSRADHGTIAAATVGRRVRPTGRARRIVRFVGTALIVLGIGAVAWSIVVWRWQDPFTGLYTTYQQHKLAGRYHKIAETYQPLLVERSKAGPAKALPAKTAPARKAVQPVAQDALERRLVALDAKRYRSTVHAGTPLGRIKIRRIGLNIVLVTGTDHDSLTKGPGWDQRTYLPGSGSWSTSPATGRPTSRPSPTSTASGRATWSRSRSRTARSCTGFART